MVPSESNRPSTPQPKRMASTASLMADQDHNTIPDPRMRSMSPCNTDSAPSPVHHPDLDQEVAALSTKLINAINHSTNLDDTLSVTRQELESSRERVKELEAIVASQQETLSGDVWVKRHTVEEDKNKLLSRIAHEKRLRADVEKDKKKIEQELENLTVSLFEEANKMVISAKEDAKKDQEALLRKNEQLRAQLSDTEGLLVSQQEQLAELKLVMGQMTTDADEHVVTAPSSPGHSRIDAGEEDTSRLSDRASHVGSPEPSSPTYATDLSHLVHPILRTDISAYDDFVTLVRTSKKQTASRASSGSFTGLNPLLGFTGSGTTQAPSNASTASLSTSGTTSTNTSPLTPNTPASAISSAPAVPLPALKETKFYKRVLAEDIEPTLRLDTAPGLSWLARRSVIGAMTEGSLVVEPVPANTPFATITKPQHYACSLCGETRKDPAHLRNHRFRTSEAETAQRYPLCKYCLNRVRSTCDFLGFLRIVKDGHWRADDCDAERTAWEESVKLREQMFWSRIGGGLVSNATHSHSGSLAENNSRTSQEAGRLSPGLLSPDMYQDRPTRPVTDPSQHDTADEQPSPVIVPQQPDADEEKTEAGHETEQPSLDTSLDTEEPASETHAPSDDPMSAERDPATRLSITIPGSFAAVC